MQKHIYNGVEYDIEVAHGKPVAVYRQGERIVGPLADAIMAHFTQQHVAPEPVKRGFKR
ncbi:hypothetical protein LU196_05875 [Pantoea sp. Mb-10]|uniref:hypothetical protein n=1 Tax=unclassified Pantoea TaxID=2630326 RepID=UPI001E2E488C|nr:MULTISPECIES: hypothetical protein [unclassified Pantoea]MCE0489582.1 hypothetical protein [Pantoea sp. Mb-10]MCE0502110.1 hypothetical protein [Pantoea sp. Pb-8]